MGYRLNKLEIYTTYVYGNASVQVLYIYIQWLKMQILHHFHYTKLEVLHFVSQKGHGSLCEQTLKRFT